MVAGSSASGCCCGSSPFQPGNLSVSSMYSLADAAEAMAMQAVSASAAASAAAALTWQRRAGLVAAAPGGSRDPVLHCRMDARRRPGCCRPRSPRLWDAEVSLLIRPLEPKRLYEQLCRLSQSLNHQRRAQTDAAVY